MQDEGKPVAYGNSETRYWREQFPQTTFYTRNLTVNKWTICSLMKFSLMAISHQTTMVKRRTKGDLKELIVSMPGSCQYRPLQVSRDGISYISERQDL